MDPSVCMKARIFSRAYQLCGAPVVRLAIRRRVHDGIAQGPDRYFTTEHGLNNNDTSLKKTHKAEGGPLSGIRILDLTRVLAAPLCSMVLGDLGAEVIKIERPGVGDDTRRWGPPFIGTESAYFWTVNRNKKSVCVDLKSKEGVTVITELAQKSDIMIENYRPGKLSELGLGYEQMKEVNPRLIYCSITGYGSVGPYKDRAGIDVIVEAMGGFMHITGPEDGEPVKAGVALTDVITGLYSHGAILAALYERQFTNKGQKIEADLLSSQVASLQNVASNYLNAGQEGNRWGTAHESIVPYQAFQTSDGYVVVGALNDIHFKSLCNILEVNDLPTNDLYKTNKDRVKNRTSLIDIINKIFSKQSTNYWLEALASTSLPYGPLNNVTQVFNDPHVIQSSIVKTLHHPSYGPMKVVGPPVKYSRSVNEARSAPPLLGEHTRDVLRNLLHYSNERIDMLHSMGVIGTVSHE